MNTKQYTLSRNGVSIEIIQGFDAIDALDRFARESGYISYKHARRCNQNPDYYLNLRAMVKT